MTNTADRNLIVGLDIGTTKVAVLVGEVLPDGELNVIGMGSHASRGMEKGGVNDLDSVVKSLRRAVEEAEMMADCQISSVYLGLSGKHIDCRNETGMVPISDEEVTQEDVDNVIHTAKSVRLSDELRVLHVLPRSSPSTIRKGSRTRSASPACGWQPRCISSPATTTWRATSRSVWRRWVCGWIS
jgi:cell division protein FtsA